MQVPATAAIVLPTFAILFGGESGLRSVIGLTGMIVIRCTALFQSHGKRYASSSFTLISLRKKAARWKLPATRIWLAEILMTLPMYPIIGLLNRKVYSHLILSVLTWKQR